MSVHYKQTEERNQERLLVNNHRAIERDNGHIFHGILGLAVCRLALVDKTTILRNVGMEMLMECFQSHLNMPEKSESALGVLCFHRLFREILLLLTQLRLASGDELNPVLLRA